MGNHKNDEARIGSYLVIPHLSSWSCRTRIHIHSARHKGLYDNNTGKVILQDKKGRGDQFTMYGTDQKMCIRFSISGSFLSPCQWLSHWFPRDTAVGFQRTLFSAFSNCFIMSILFLSWWKRKVNENRMALHKLWTFCGIQFYKRLFKFWT